MVDQPTPTPIASGETRAGLEIKMKVSDELAVDQFLMDALHQFSLQVRSAKPGLKALLLDMLTEISECLDEVKSGELSSYDVLRAVEPLLRKQKPALDGDGVPYPDQSVYRNEGDMRIDAERDRLIELVKEVFEQDGISF